jgi:hypothetical protein
MPFDPVDSPVCPVLGASSGEVILHNQVIFHIKDIRAPFQKKHPENIFFKLGSIHLASQDICCRKKMVFKLAECQFFHKFF